MLFTFCMTFNCLHIHATQSNILQQILQEVFVESPFLYDNQTHTGCNFWSVHFHPKSLLWHFLFWFSLSHDKVQLKIRNLQNLVLRKNKFFLAHRNNYNVKDKGQKSREGTRWMKIRFLMTKKILFYTLHEWVFKKFIQ